MNDSPTLFSLPEYNQEPNNIEFRKAKPRLNVPIRNQIEFTHSCLDDLIPEDHQVRNIWAYVEQMDLSIITSKILSTSGNPGRSATDPKILFCLWIYALTEGIGSARLINRYASEHLAFKWICGGVDVNYHTISDFRKNNAEEFDQLISMTIARLMERDLVTLNRTSQDGMRVRASAGSSSFRRKPKLKELLAIAKEQVEALRREIDEDPSACLNRQMAAKKRAAEERKERITQAIEEHKKQTTAKGQTKKNIVSPLLKKKKKQFEHP
jgi:transposase